MPNVKPVPEGYHTITAALCVDGCARAIELYKKALGAEERHVMMGPGGKVVHAEVKVGDSFLMLADPMPNMDAGPNRSGFYLYVTDCDAWFKRAVGAGFTAEYAPTDMFWGDRFGSAKDPFGNSWGFATHKEDVAPAEMRRRQQEWMAKMSG